MCSIFRFVFSVEVVIFLNLTIVSCSDLCGMQEREGPDCVYTTLSLWDKSGKAPCNEEKERGEGRGEGGREKGRGNPMFCSHAHLLLLTPLGYALTSAGISLLLTLTHAFPLPPRKPHQIPCALQELLGGPIAAWPCLDWRDCCLAALLGCGVGLNSLSTTAQIAVAVS